MAASKNRKRSMFHAENVFIGEESSRISSAIFFLLCIILFFSTILFGGVDNVTWIFISVFWAAIILLWLAETWKGRGILFNPSALQIPVIGLLAIGLVQILPLGGLGNANDILAVKPLYTLSLEPYATRFFVTRLAVYLVFFAACLAFINNKWRLKKIVYSVIIFGALMAFFGILQRLANPDAIYGVRGTPQAIPFGPFVNQHHFAAFMQMTGGVTVGLLFGKKKGREQKVLLTTAIVIMGVACVLTSSRGGLLGFVSVLVFVLLLHFMTGKLAGESTDTVESYGGIYRKIAAALAAIALVAVVFGVVLFIGGNDSLLRGVGVVNADADLSSGRFHFWPIAIKIFLEHPITGAGFDAFGVAFTRHDTWSGQMRVEQAHNDYLQTLADAGIAGFLCIAGFIFLLFKKGLDTISKTDGLRRDAAVGALAGCFGILIHSFFDFPLRTPSNTFFFLLLCALATVPLKSVHSTSRKQPQTSSGL